MATYFEDRELRELIEDTHVPAQHPDTRNITFVCVFDKEEWPCTMIKDLRAWRHREFTPTRRTEPPDAAATA